MSTPRGPNRSRKGRRRPAAVPAGFGPPADAPTGLARSAPDHSRDIQDLIDLVKRNNLSELEVEQGGIRIRIRRDAAGGAQAAPARESVRPT